MAEHVDICDGKSMFVIIGRWWLVVSILIGLFLILPGKRNLLKNPEATTWLLVFDNNILVRAFAIVRRDV